MDDESAPDEPMTTDAQEARDFAKSLFSHPLDNDQPGAVADDDSGQFARSPFSN